MKTIQILLIAAVFSAVCPIAPLNAQQVFASRADAYIDAWANDGQFTGIVAVARNGTPLYVKSVGMASTDWGAPIGMDTKFRLGSITKQFTAVCILQLQEQGKLTVGQKMSEDIRVQFSTAKDGNGWDGTRWLGIFRREVKTEIPDKAMYY
jgi:CubicO group peptidase (beta-lactamase class C family)